ncbi:hypothetical protein PISMIDRAFT_101567 [Pisolithus microcarpus 441]|uniref:Helitron helicase-like domain-containing protein n=1 Tax=Pisolithus microcarpus 441 TaxID=765257 RepID=A0A0C9ZAF6_9AGAM|nr:hypothetical protein PISMIDRAFT_101567 [Pisolithus microcarpus 441]
MYSSDSSLHVYVFKLYLKCSGGVQDTSVLQSTTRGNVCTYDHNMDTISNMVEGRLMLCPPTILASLVTITFVGVGKLPSNWLWTTFWVQQHTVREALQWLKKNNPKYYSAIEISNEHLGDLPEDDVPMEIIIVIRQMDDVGIIEQESERYVPQDDDESVSFVTQAMEQCECSYDTYHTNLIAEPADVMPLQVSGMIDTEMSTITACKMMVWGLSNLWEEGREGAYMVRHGNRPINDSGQGRRNGTKVAEDIVATEMNLFKRVYPCLFPYGVGGIERHQQVKLDFADHIRWTLQYHDHCFHRHDTFPFICFGIFRHFSTMFKKMQHTQEEEDCHLPITDPAICLLRQHLYSTAGCIVSTNQSCYQLRSQIWATSIMFNPPSLWIMINPCNLHDPVMQVFAGEHIDLDNFLNMVGPPKDVCTRNIAQDPYAAAKFFHFMVNSIIQTLFGISATPHQVLCSQGVFGTVNAYFGVVESQGCGSLHLHILLWLKDVLSIEEMEQLLKEQAF